VNSISIHYSLLTTHYFKGWAELGFFKTVIRRTLTEKAFRKEFFKEILFILKDTPLGLPFTRRSEYVYCRYVSPPPGRGKWVAPQLLATRIGAYGVLINEQEEVLLVRDQTMQFNWNLPGGGVHKGETMQEALKREFLEETGIEVEVGQVVATWDDFQIMPHLVPTHSFLHFFLVKAVGGELKPQGNGFDTSEVAYLAPNTNDEDPAISFHLRRMRRMYKRALELHSLQNK
jgi:8-oxo-dGTP diphosphatase